MVIGSNCWCFGQIIVHVQNDLDVNLSLEGKTKLATILCTILRAHIYLISTITEAQGWLGSRLRRQVYLDYGVEVREGNGKDAGYWVLDVSVIVEDRVLALYSRHWEPARASAPDSSAVYSLRGWRSLTWQGGPERCTPRTSQTPPPWWSWGPRTHSPGPLPPPCSHPKTEGGNL